MPAAAYIVSAFSTDLSIVFGQERVDEKSNEIMAIPELREAHKLKGYLVSIDAMGGQKDIAGKIITKGGDYLLMVMGNKPSLLERVSDAFSEGRRVAQLTWTAPASAAAIAPAQWPPSNSTH